MSIGAPSDSPAPDIASALVAFHAELSRLVELPRATVSTAADIAPATEALDGLRAAVRALMWSDDGRALDASLSPTIGWSVDPSADPLYRLFERLGEWMDEEVPLLVERLVSADELLSERPDTSDVSVGAVVRWADTAIADAHARLGMLAAASATVASTDSAAVVRVTFHRLAGILDSHAAPTASGLPPRRG